MKDYSIDLCTLNCNSNCNSCHLQDKIACKHDKGIAKSFGAIGAPPMIINLIASGIIGYLTEQWWIVITLAIFTFSVFGFIEMGFLCKHCPYYATDTKTLKCLGNNGSLKLFKFDPGPMNKREQFLMKGLVIFYFVIAPLMIHGYLLFTVLLGDYQNIILILTVGLAVASLLASIVFLQIVFTFFCSVCVNFSCPYNKVEKEVVDSYLKKNPIMHDAWARKDYKVD